MKSTAITVKFPAPLPAEIPCPICAREEGKRGGGCLVCDYQGRLHITVDAKIPIQRGHIIKYVADNMSSVASELTRVYGLVPQVETVEVVDGLLGQFEVVQVSSLGGAIWIANRLDDFESPKYFYKRKDLEEFRNGVKDER